MSALFSSPSARQLDAALALLRATLGTIFIAHGAQKLFVYGFAGVAGAFGQMGIPAPEVTGPAVALIEFFGGIALVLGLLTRIAAVGVGFIMLGAIVLVHLTAGFFAPNGIEFPLALLAAAAALAVTGAGKYSLDALIAAKQQRARAGVTGATRPQSRRAA